MKEARKKRITEANQEHETGMYYQAIAEDYKTKGNETEAKKYYKIAIRCFKRSIKLRSIP